MAKLISFYGDDFTGSTDVMEALATHGIATVLFTRIPTQQEFAEFQDYQAIGLAGSSRSQSPQWMDENLPQAFTWLKSLGAKFCHYKICSTFDSSPTIGSIGRATEIGLEIFAQNNVSMIVGAPQLKRYTFAGHLFAGYQGAIYRIDHHPVMSKHPVTPMHEPDVLKHFAKQSSAKITFTDVHDTATQKQAGQEILKHTEPFIVGSSGVEYALMKALELPTISFKPLEKVDRLMVVSGSVSPTTERQIRFAISQGFEGIALDPLQLIGENGEQQISAIIKSAVATLQLTRSVIAYTALGASSDIGTKLDAVARTKLGAALGRILAEVVAQCGVRRAIIAGGDSSSHALSQLDIYALTTRFPLTATPGSPLCIAHSANKTFNGLEIAMKGGQVGGDDYFVELLG